MSDEVKAVAKEILDRTEGQIGTHSTDCHALAAAQRSTGPATTCTPSGAPTAAT